MAFEEWKADRSAAWGSAPFELVAETLTDIHVRLVDLLAPRSGERWLDLATGTGRVAFLAAARGADATGLDFAPGLVATARALARERGIHVRFDVGDAEALPYGDGSFDVVSSVMGLVFAPDHAAVARELGRVCRRGGRIGFSAWRPDPEFDGALAEFYAPGPDGAGDPTDWSDEEYVHRMLGDAFELEFVAGDSPLVAESGEAVWQLLVSSVGTLKATAEALGPRRRERFHRTYVEQVERHRTNGGVTFPRGYVITIGKRKETHG